MHINQNIASLRGMASRGLIILHQHTGTKIEGLNSAKKFTCYYVEDYGPNGRAGFEYQGWTYKLTYVSGCFCPYVETIGPVNQKK